MPIAPFKLERYFAQYEFKVQYLFSASDCEALAMDELLRMASPESLELWQGLRLSYTESPGHPRLRREIAGLYPGLAPENVVVSVPEELIYIAMRTLLTPGDHVVAISPTYQSLYEIARSIGCSVTPWKLQPIQRQPEPVEGQPGGWQADLEGLERLITPHTRLLVINFPNNPTGCLPSLAEFEAIIALARRHGLPVFCDEMYRLLEQDPAERLPAMCEAYELGISLSGLSKSFALPGLRLGWLAAQNMEWVERWLTFKDYTTICNSAPGEILGIIALQNAGRIVERNLEIIRSNCTAAEGFFAAWPGLFAWSSPPAGSIAFPRWLGAGTAEQFCRDVLDGCGVMIVPGEMFDWPGQHFRVGLGRVNFPQALEQVEAYLNRRAG